MPPILVPPIGVPPGSPHVHTAPPNPAPPPPGPVPVLPVESDHKTSNDSCIRRLQDLQIEPPRKIYPPTTAPSQLGSPITVQTNIFGLEVTGTCTLYQYIVHIKADLSVKKEVIFTKKGKEDFVVLDRHAKCCEIFFRAVDDNPDFFQHQTSLLVYDGQSTLYSLLDLFPGVGEKSQKYKSIQVDGAKTKLDDLHPLPCIKVEIFQAKNPPIIFSADSIARRTADANIEANNRGYTQVFELIMNQECIRSPTRFACFEHGKSYFIDPSASGFHQGDVLDVGDGKQIIPGAKKRIQFIEGPNGRGQNNPALVIDAMKAAFHKEQNIYDKICEILQKIPSGVLNNNDREKCAGVIKGLDVHTTYTKRIRHLKVEGLHTSGAQNSKFELPDGTAVTVVQYFKEKYNVQLRYPTLNLLICKERGRSNFYPLELMIVTKNQRVSIPQQTGAQSQRTTKECAVEPAIRQRLIMTAKNASNISGHNELLANIGVGVCPDPLLVSARQLPGVPVKYTGRPVPTALGKWRTPSGHYFRPAVPPAVWAMYVVGSSSAKFTNEDMRKFGEQFLKMSRERGINFPPVSDCKLIPAENIEGVLKTAAEAKCKFIFVITEDNITHLHQRYKVFERDHEMIVQDMTMSKALNVVHKGKWQTLENVINKTNVKLGGTNYVVESRINTKANMLIIGIGISAPPPGSKYMLEGKGFLNPSIIGYAYNAKADHEFHGDFVLNSVGQDTIAPIEDIMKHTLNDWVKARGSPPKTVLIYRSGAPEGAHGPIIAYEIPLARSVIESVSKDIKLEYLVVTKDHGFRFFPNTLVPHTLASSTEAKKSASGSVTSSGSSSSATSFVTDPKANPRDAKKKEDKVDDNVSAGLLLDTIVTHPACKQFFLNSHKTLQGTARTPLYTVLADDHRASLETLEGLTYELCHNHQIVSLTTSLPTPLYVANEYAKRGRNLFAERIETVGAVKVGESTESARLHEITEEIGYRGTGTLYERRINA